MFRKFVGHCLTYGQGKGVKVLGGSRVGVLCYNMFLAKWQETLKQP
jgi:hypothetical protein